MILMKGAVFMKMTLFWFKIKADSQIIEIQKLLPKTINESWQRRFKLTVEDSCFWNVFILISVTSVNSIIRSLLSF